MFEVSEKTKSVLNKQLAEALAVSEEFRAKAIITAYASDSRIIESGEVDLVVNGNGDLVNAITITSNPVDRPTMIGVIQVKLADETVEDWDTSYGLVMNTGDRLAFKAGSIIIRL